MDIESALKNIGDWISKETESRKYPKGELLELSESLQALKSEIARQSIKGEEVAISKTETTSEPCEYCRKPIYLKWNVSFIDGYYKLNDDCNFCPNCGRKLD